MNYLEWNDAVASYLFNEDKEGERVFLYLTQKEIIQLYCDHLQEERSGSGVWKDFVRALNHPAFPGYAQDLSEMGLFDRMLELHRLSHLRMYQGVFKYPPYILYLVALVLPLTELAAGENALTVNQNNYYERAKAYFSKNRIFFQEDDFSTPELKRICTSNKEKGFYDLWMDLEQWSQMERKHKVGDFSKMIIGKDVYVGTIRSQCLVTADELRKLPQIFWAARLEEGEEYEPEEFHKALVKYGKGILRESVWQVMVGRGNEEVKKMILNIVAVNHFYWDGALYRYDNQNKKQAAELYGEKKLKLQLIKVRNEVTWTYRMFSKKGYPNDLEIGGQFVADEKEGWSCTLKYGFDGNSFTKSDRSSKWQLRFEAKDIYLLGKNPAMPFIPKQSCYIQQNELSRYEEMLLLAREAVAGKIREWGQTFEEGNFTEIIEWEGVPEGFVLFRFRYPKRSLEEVKELSLPVLTKVKVSGGLPVGERKYLPGVLPKVYLEGGNGTEELWVNYEDGNKAELVRQERDGAVYWALPAGMKVNTPFTITMEQGVFEQNLKYEITEPLFPEDYEWRKRNNLGEEYRDEGSYIVGNVPECEEKVNLLKLPTQNEHFFQFAVTSAAWDVYSKGNLLADWLYFKGRAAKLMFYEVFDHLYYRDNEEYQWENTDRKRYALNWLHYAGFVDYDYKTGKVTALPPAFIALPAEHGPNRFLLVGSRSCRMLEEICRFCGEHRRRVRMEISRQDESLKNLLLPDVVIIEVTGDEMDDYGVSYIRELAGRIGVSPFVEMQLQAKLAAFAPDIQDLTGTGGYVELDEFHRTVKKLYFDRERFVFTDKPSSFPEDDLVLVEFQLNKWSTEYGLVKKEGGQEKVRFLNKNWGRFLILEHYCTSCSSAFEGAKNTGMVFYDTARQCLAVRAGFPLPEFLNKAIIFLSGYLPARRKLLINEHTHFYYIYRDCPPAFIRAVFLTKMNIILESFSYEGSYKIV